MCKNEQKYEQEFKPTEFIEFEWSGSRWLVAEVSENVVQYWREKADFQKRKYWDSMGTLGRSGIETSFLAAMLHALNNKNKT